jgi:cellulose synthase/poly-beta-1,6-N-acetylglucosamine synthase-like glycosyltransferase
VNAHAARFPEPAPGPLRSHLDQTGTARCRALRRLVTAACLLPVLCLLIREVVRLPEGGVCTGYGIAVLAGSTGMLYIAYTRYDDPSEHRLRTCHRERACRERACHREEFPPLPAAPRVSFLLAVKDEADAIEACVRSMARAAAQVPDTRVTVVNDGSRDGTGAILDRLKGELGVTVLHLAENVGKKQALVHALATADGDVLAFTDSDCLIAPDALRRCVGALVRNPELGAVSGHCRALNAEDGFLTRLQDIWYEGQFRIAKAAEASFGSVSCVSGPLAVFRRAAIHNYLPAWAEDRFLGAPFRFATDRQLTGYVLGQKWQGERLKERYAGSPFVHGEDHPPRRWQVGYVRSARVWTNVPATAGALLRQQIRWKKSFIRNLFFTGSFMWRRGVGPAALYYGHVACVLAAPVMAVRHMVWGPWHGAYFLTFLYLCGVALKGCVWGLAYRADHPGDVRWRYRPVMSLLSSLALAWLLPYSLLTMRRDVWTRSPA